MIRSSGTWCDVTLVGDKPIYTYSTRDGEVIEEFPSGQVRAYYPLKKWLLYLRSCGGSHGVLHIGQDHTSGHALYTVNGGTTADLGPCHGQNPVSVVFLDDEDPRWLVWVMRRGRYDSYSVNWAGTYTLLNTHLLPHEYTQGFLHSSVLADEFRELVDGLVFPYHAGNDYHVGQNAGPDPARLRVAQGDNRASIVEGFFQRPTALLHDGVLHTAAWGTKGSQWEAIPVFAIPWGNDTAPVDIPFQADPSGVILDVLPYLEGPLPAYARPDCLALIKSDTDPAYAEWWSFDSENVYHEFDRTRQPGDLGWWLDPLPIFLPRQIRTGQTWSYTGEIIDLGGTPAPAGRHPFRFTNRVEVAREGTIGGRPIAFILTFDPRKDQDPNGRWRGAYEKFIFGSHGLLRWESWKTNYTNTGDYLAHSANTQFPRKAPLAALPSPRPPTPRPDPEPEPMPTRLPNDDQMRNAMARIHVEGYHGHLRRYGGIFEAPGNLSLITDPRREGVLIDDSSLSVWIGRYVRYFTEVTFGDPHETAIRRVLQDLYNSDEARGKRGGQDPIEEAPLPPLVGRLQRTGRIYHDALGTVKPVFLHAGDLLLRARRGNWHYIEGVFDLCRRAGYHGVRTWTCLAGDYWRGREFAADRALLEDFGALSIEYGLQHILSPGDMWRAVNPVEHADELEAALNSRPTRWVAVLEAGNETWQNGQEDPNQLRLWHRRIDYPVLRINSSPPDETPQLMALWGTGADLRDAHSQAGDYSGNIRRIWNAAKEAQGDAQTEPRGFGRNVSVYNQVDRDTAVLMAIAAVSSGQLYTFMSSPGVISDGTPYGIFDQGERFEDMPGFWDVPKEVAKLPLDVGSFQLIHGGTSQAGKRIFAVPGLDETRADHSIAEDGRFTVLVHGPRWREVTQVIPTREFTRVDCGERGFWGYGRL